MVVMIKDYSCTEEELELIRRSMEINNHHQGHHHYQNHDDHDHNDIYNNDNNGTTGDHVNGLCMKVMTDEQIEVLRKQISAYATLTQQLADMHKFMSAQQDLTAAAGLGSLYCDSLMAYGGNKMATRHRWTPTPVQLQKLERVFEEGIGTPSKQKIKDITAELSQYGPISETNVYNWFQNRRARSKRKQSAEAPNNSGAADVEAESESSEKTTRSAYNVTDKAEPIATNAYIQDPPSTHSLDTEPGKGKSSFTSGHNTKPYGSHGSN